MTTDRFGVPHKLLGFHDEDFYSLLGRVTALFALLENHVLVLYQALVNSHQDEHTARPMSDLIRCCRPEIDRLYENDREVVAAFLDEASRLAPFRHDLVHNLWPSQPTDRLFGWRPQRRPNSTSATRTTETTLSEVQASLDDLVRLLGTWQATYALVSSRSHMTRETS